MEQREIEAMERLNRHLLARNLAQASTPDSPAFVVISGVAAGAVGFALLMILLHCLRG
jgi:hypothetical protein